jgi:hypothetical protein
VGTIHAGRLIRVVPRRTTVDQAEANAPTTVSASILALQRAAGNAAVTRLIVAQRDGGHAPAAPAKSTDLDARALAIIKAAQASTPSIDERAVAAVQAILETYYSDRKAMVSAVRYAEAEPGLKTTARGKGEKVTGLISVGHYFITDTTEQHFARRVLQVGHELEHIQQHREGKGGEGHRHEREFLAFYHEATVPELAHTGRMSHSTRVEMMDEAIRNYNAMPEEQRKQHASEFKDLLEQRVNEQRKTGRPATEPPTDAAP